MWAARAGHNSGPPCFAVQTEVKIHRLQKSMFLYKDEELQEDVENKIQSKERYTVQGFRDLCEMMRGHLLNYTMNQGQKKSKNNKLNLCSVLCSCEGKGVVR